MTVGDKVRQLRLERGMTQEELAVKVGFRSRSSINKIELGTRQIPREMISDFARILECSETMLLGLGAGGDFDVIMFDVVGSVAAGYGSNAVETHTGDKVAIPAQFLCGRDKDEFFVLQIKGMSMYPKFLEGDLVLVRRCESVDSGSVAVILYNGDEATVKVVEYEPGCDWMRLRPINPEYPVKTIKGGELRLCRVLGQVVKLIRDV